MKAIHACIFAICAIFTFTSCTTKIATDEELARELKVLKSDEKLESSNTLEQHVDFIKNFYKLFDDPELHEFIDKALANNINLLTLDSKINQAKAQARISAASIFPSLSANVRQNYTDNFTQSQTIVLNTGTQSIQGNLSLSWELDLFGKLNALRKASKREVLSAYENLEAAKISLLAEVTTLFYTLKINQFELEQNQKMLKNLESNLETAKIQYRQGLINLSTFKNAQDSYINQANSVETLNETFTSNKVAMIILLDEKMQFFDENFSAKLNLPDLAILNPRDLKVQNILSRPDIKASIYTYHASLYRATNAKAARMPSISLGGSIGMVLLSNRANFGSLVYQIANSIAMPILNRASLKQNYRIAQETSKQSFLALKNSLNTALGEVEKSITSFNSKTKLAQNQKNNLEISNNTLAVDSVLFKKGMMSASDYASSQNANIASTSAYLNAKINEILAAIVLFKAFGGDLTMSNQVSN